MVGAYGDDVLGKRPAASSRLPARVRPRYLDAIPSIDRKLDDLLASPIWTDHVITNFDCVDLIRLGG